MFTIPSITKIEGAPPAAKTADDVQFIKSARVGAAVNAILLKEVVV